MSLISTLLSFVGIELSLRFPSITLENQGMYATEGSSGFDILSNEKCDDKPSTAVIFTGDVYKFNTGIKIKSYKYFKVSLFGCGFSVVPELQIRPKSGLSSRGLMVAYGTVDCDYPGEVGVIMYNHTCTQSISYGQKIAQGVFSWSFRPLGFVKSERRVGGFGSTGK